MQPMLHYLSTSRACEGDGENSISTMVSPPSGALNIPPPRREGDNLSRYHSSTTVGVVAQLAPLHYMPMYMHRDLSIFPRKYQLCSSLPNHS